MSQNEFKSIANTPEYKKRYNDIGYLTQNELITTTMDARSNDANAVIEQQNILFAIATVTATTFLISALFLANE
jgi:hypothetical protein